MKKYAIRTSDGYNEDWIYFNTKNKALKEFESYRQFDVRHTSVYLYENSKMFGYEVVDSYQTTKTNNRLKRKDK